MRIIKNLRWLFNHPPTDITTNVPLGTKCDYCGTTEQLWNSEHYFCICKPCMKKALDAVLKSKVGGALNGYDN